MKNSWLKAVYTLLAVASWFIIYELFAKRVDLGFIIPGLKDTFVEFIGLFGSLDFYKSVCTSLIRIVTGYTLGALLGIILALRTEET